jgi:hypothetical protein
VHESGLVDADLHSEEGVTGSVNLYRPEKTLYWSLIVRIKTQLKVVALTR